MTVEEFERAFAEGIRANVNWRAARRSNWPITCRVLSPRQAGKLLVPWYAKGSALSDRREAMTVARAATLPRKSAGHAKQILSVASRLRDGDVICAPAVKTPRGTILLDACHRVVAAHLSPAASMVVLFTIRPKGPGRAAFWDA